ncbi:MAG: 2-hydroxyacyl-CoA dehydratase [Verrucomicrobia bacterium]|nr:2-hydroxyacyl-CoA dehydratase [Verrucomicrobiota bacterium]
MQIFFSSPWIPAEWIRAHGLEARALGFAPDLDLAAARPGAGVCAYAEAVVGWLERHAESAAVFASTCDQMRRAFDIATRRAPSRSFLFNVPATWQTPTAGQMFRAELERLGRFLEALGGRAPQAEDLVRRLADSNGKRRRLLAGAPRCRAHAYAAAVARFHWDGSEAVIEPSGPLPAEAVPLALVGGPLPMAHWGLIEALERAGGRVALNATETGERSLLPQFRLDQARTDPVAALVHGYLGHSVDVFQRPNTRLYAWLGQQVAAWRIRGLVLWHFVGCDLWRAEAQSLREAFRLPVLVLEAGEGAGDSPRSLGRLEAFLELLKSAASNPAVAATADKPEAHPATEASEEPR